MMPETQIRNPPAFRQDFILSETEYLDEAHLPLGDGETEAVFDLYCRDYGGKSRVHVELTGHGWANLTRTLTIPRDDDNDGMADCWEETVHGPVETNALDFITKFLPTEPRDPDGGGLRAAHLTEGDGLSPFDEYRGYSLPGPGSVGGRTHLRLSPARKEMILQVDVASTNNIAVVSAEEAYSTVAGVADIFERDLGIRLHWYLPEPHDRLAVATGHGAWAWVNAYKATLAPSCPPLHSGSGVRRLVFTSGIPLNANSRRALGYARNHCALVDVAQCRDYASSSSPMHDFLDRIGADATNVLLHVTTHEIGHTAGCRGDVVIREDAVALTVVSHLPSLGPCKAWAGSEGRRGFLYLSLPGLGTEKFELYGTRRITVGELAAAINESDGFRATHHEDWAAADAARLAPTSSIRNEIVFNNPAGASLALRPQAMVNGVMTYNDFSPTIWTAPAFENAGASETGGPLKELYDHEVGTVEVLRAYGD